MEKKVNIVGCTGNRNLKHPIPIIKAAIKEKLFQAEADAVITGMALGFDMLVAEVCIENNIPFVAAIPCRGQTRLWPKNEVERYRKLIEKSYKHTIVSPGEFQTWKLFERNKWIVNRADIVIAYWDGAPKGGTHHCYKYAQEKNKLKENIFDFCSLLETNNRVSNDIR